MANSNKQEIHRQTAEKIFEMAELASLGFKFSKTKGITRKEFQFEDSIGFSSSARSNMLDGVNMFIVTVSTDDSIYRKWEQEVLKRAHGMGTIGAGKIKNLFTPGPPYISFDLGENEGQHQAVIKDVTRIITEEVVPFFLLCRSPEKIAEHALLPAFHIPKILEYFHFLHRSDLIHIALKNKIEAHPEFHPQLNYFYNKIKSDGIPALGFKEAFGDEMKVSAANTATKLFELGITTTLL